MNIIHPPPTLDFNILPLKSFRSRSLILDFFYLDVLSLKESTFFCTLLPRVSYKRVINYWIMFQKCYFEIGFQNLFFHVGNDINNEETSL